MVAGTLISPSFFRVSSHDVKNVPIGWVVLVAGDLISPSFWRVLSHGVGVVFGHGVEGVSSCGMEGVSSCGVGGVLIRWVVLVGFFFFF